MGFEETFQTENNEHPGGREWSETETTKAPDGEYDNWESHSWETEEGSETKSNSSWGNHITGIHETNEHVNRNLPNETEKSEKGTRSDENGSETWESGDSTNGDTVKSWLKNSRTMTNGATSHNDTANESIGQWSSVNWDKGENDDGQGNSETWDEYNSMDADAYVWTNRNNRTKNRDDGFAEVTNSESSGDISGTTWAISGTRTQPDGSFESWDDGSNNGVDGNNENWSNATKSNTDG